MDAGAAVFAEKGYDGATMTEIAARASTAIGSLYRFFPTKGALADALLNRYGNFLVSALDGIEARSARLSASGLADALVDFVLGLLSDRAAVIALIDTRDDAASLRSAFRASMRNGITRILLAWTGLLRPAKAEIMATLILHILKSLPRLVRDEVGSKEELIGEARELVRLYLSRIRRLANDEAGRMRLRDHAASGSAERGQA